MGSDVELSVVMPTLNEEKAIEKVVRDIRKNAKGYKVEILIVDSSTDRTPAIAKKLGVRVIRQPKQGHGMALRKAMLGARGRVILTADCDDTYPMDRIPELFGMVSEKRADIVSCNRMNAALGKQMPLMNKIGNWLFAYFTRLFYGIGVHDVSTGMFCMRREVAHGIAWETNYSFPAEIIIRANLAGYRHLEVPIKYRIRVGTPTLDPWKSGKAYFGCILKYKFGLGIKAESL